METEILHTKLFRRKFSDCISRLPNCMAFAVPFIGKIPPFGSIVEFSRTLVARGGKLTLITRPPAPGEGTIGFAEADLIENLGVRVLFRPGLHSKVYQFSFREGDRGSFVGSANLTMGGLRKNDETVAYFGGKCENDAVAKELSRLLGVGAVELRHWKVQKGR